VYNSCILEFGLFTPYCILLLVIQVYGVAELVAARRLRDGAPGNFVEGPTVDRFLVSSLSFDHDWKRSPILHLETETESEIERLAAKGEEKETPHRGVAHHASTGLHADEAGARQFEFEPQTGRTHKGPVVVPSRSAQGNHLRRPLRRPVTRAGACRRS